MGGQNPVAMTISRNMRRFRASRAWSLNQLAARCGVSKGALVQLEQGHANPRLATLCKVADALGISVTALIAPTETTGVSIVHHNEGLELWAGIEGSYGRLLMSRHNRESVELWKWVLAPGDSCHSEAHIGGTHELLHVVRGVLTLGVNGTEYEIASGDTAAFCAEDTHSYSNEQETPLELMMVVVQPK